MMLTSQLQARIEQEAKDYAQKRCDDLEGKKHLHRKTLLMYAHQEGAKAYASLWQQAEQRAEQLEQWKKEAQALLTPIFDWGQKELPLGTCSATEALRRAKEYDGLKEKAERYESVLRLIQEQAADPDNDNDPGISLWNILNFCNEALTPKTTNNE